MNAISTTVPAVIPAPVQRYLDETPNEPCAYIYDLDQLAEHGQRLQADLPDGFELLYAIKANSDQPVLKTLAPHIDGLEVASAGEVALARQAAPELPIAFGGPGKTASELRQALDAKVEVYHLESALQLERLAELAAEAEQKVKVMLRVNPRLKLPKATLQMGGAATQFGIDENDIPGLILRAKALSPWIKLVGFHFHALSNNLDPDQHIALLDHYFERVERWRSQFDLQIGWVNVGGGIGVDYQQPEWHFPWKGFCQQLRELHQRWKPKYRTRFECGRLLSAYCGYYLAEVTDLKTVQGEEFAILRGGSHHFRLPSSWQHNHPFQVLPRDQWSWRCQRPVRRNCPVNLCGELCTPKDRLARQVQVEQLRAGDCVLFLLAGAYGWHISHHQFLSHPQPDRLYWQNGRWFCEQNDTCQIL